MKKYESISCHHFVEKNGYAYFSNWMYNGLFCTELKSGKTKFLGAFQNEKYDEVNLHWELLLIKDLVYFFPRRARHIHIFSLTDRTVSTIEIRKASENFFWIVEVVAVDSNIFLLPMDKKLPIKCCDLKNRIVKDIMNIEDVPDGICLSKNRAPFPNASLLEKYQIERVDKVSWMHMPDGRWCTFLPMGCQLLWYTPETQKIESVPLTVINEAELDVYLQSLRYACLCQGQLLENGILSLQEYLKTIVLEIDDGNTRRENWSDFPIGDSIWKCTKS